MMLLGFAVIVVLFAVSVCDENNHLYDDGELVRVFANKIGPFNNPLETYAYFEMPGCKPATEDHKFPSLGQALAGDEHYEMNLKIHFRKNVERESVCIFKPTQSDVEKWKLMLEEQYWYQLLVDDLPLWAVLGNRSGTEQKIFTHQSFSFGFNGNRIVSANLTVDEPVTPVTGQEITFRFSASFIGANIDFDKRFDRYLDDTFFEHRIHWFSIFNSFMIVLFLVGLVGAILSRTLRADYAKINEEKHHREEGKEDWIEDSGWKQLHADVFRVPQHPMLLCALVGTGSQLVIFSVSVVLVAVFSVVYTSQGSLLTYSIVVFTLTSFVSGFVSSRLFSSFSSCGPNLATKWMRCMATTALLFPGTVLLVGFLLNFVAIAYDSAQAIPFGGMVVMVLLWTLVSCPLVVVGTVVGRHCSPRETPRVNQIPRLVPPRPWYRSKWCFIAGGGILPFGCIFIELYLVFTSFWNYKLYYVYGFLFLVLMILLVVTACVAVVCTYFLVSAEDHQWQWTSFLMGASTAVYVFLYAVYFFLFKTRMTGFFMFSFYFTYMGLLCFGIAILCGTVGFLAAAMFVRRIYRNVKTD